MTAPHSEGMTVSLSDSAGYFDKIVVEYDGWYNAPSAGGYALRVRRQRIMELLDAPAGRALDVGCGPGILAAKLLARGYEFWGVDAAPHMIEYCRHRFGTRHDAHFSVSDATALPFPDEYFDVVISTGVIDFVPAYERALQEMVRVIKKGGTLLLSFPNGRSPYTLWAKHVFYPSVELLRPVYYSLIKRPPPPSMALSSNRLYTAEAMHRLLGQHGVAVTDAAYFYFNLCPLPLEQVFPRWTLNLTQRLEGLERGPLRELSAAFILKGQKSL